MSIGERSGKDQRCSIYNYFHLPGVHVSVHIGDHETDGGATLITITITITGTLRPLYTAFDVGTTATATATDATPLLAAESDSCLLPAQVLRGGKKLHSLGKVVVEVL